MIKIGQEQNTLDDTPDLKDEEVMDEHFDFKEKETEILHELDASDINPDEIFVLSDDYNIGTDDIENLDNDKVGDEKQFSFYRYFVEDRRESGSLTLLRVSSLSEDDVLVEERRKENRKKMRRTNTFSYC